jgi:serine/threonine protein kinase
VVSVSANPQRRIEGKYEILQKIREGGMGAIYKVRHRLLDEVRVVKLMRPQLVEDPEFKARFIREARVAIKLRHPNVAHLYDFTLGDDDTAFIVMEFIDGKTLEDLLKTGPPTLPLALEIAQQSLRALAYLHGKGFVHRDISPDNLMLAEDADGNPQVKLIDLGIAKVLDGQDSQLTRTGTFLGKLRYASPEQFGAAGTTAVDARADLYSFGLVLYELLTGVYPISGSDASSLIAGHLFRPPLSFAETDRQERLPPALREVVLKALAKSPDQRFASARELASELAAFRQAGDLRPEDWKSLLAADLDATANLPAARTSGTQHRLDAHFGPTTTPAPSPLFEVQKAEAQALEAGTERAELEPARTELEPVTGKLLPLLDGARELLDQGKWKEAGRMVRRAERLAPASSEVVELKARLDETSRRRAEERRRAPQIERRAAEIGRRLERGDLDGSAALLAAAVAELGEAEAWEGLRERIDVLRADVQRAQVGALLMRARQLWAKRDLQEALALVSEARQMDPENPGVQALAGELAAATGQHEKERRRAEKLDQTVAEVAARLDRNELGDASQLLDWAVMRFGPAPALREKWQHLEHLKRQARQAAGQGQTTLQGQAAGSGQDASQNQAASQAAELLRDARLLLKVEDFADAARKLARLLEIQPGNAAAQALLEQARSGLSHQASTGRRGPGRAPVPPAPPSAPPRDPEDKS